MMVEIKIGIDEKKDMSVSVIGTGTIDTETMTEEIIEITVIGGKTLLLTDVMITEAGRGADLLKVTDLTSAVIAGVTADTIETVKKVTNLTGKRRNPLGGQIRLETGTTLRRVHLRYPVFNRPTESSAMTLK